MTLGDPLGINTKYRNLLAALQAVATTPTITALTASAGTDGVGGDQLAASAQYASTTTNGWDRLRTPNTFKPFSLSASAAETTVWTPATGKKVRLMGYMAYSDTACALTFRDGSAGGTVLLDGVGAYGRVASPPMGNGILSGVANRALTIQPSASASIWGTAYGVEE